MMSFREDPRRIPFPEPQGTGKQLHEKVPWNDVHQASTGEGRKEGEKKGQLREARRLLIRLGRIRFGRLDKAIRTAIESIDDLDRLERMFVRVHGVSS